MWQTSKCDKTKKMWQFKNSKSDITQKPKCDKPKKSKCDKTPNETKLKNSNVTKLKLKIWQNSKTQNVTKHKNSKSYKTQKVKMWEKK